jgi:hypothetical protein
MNGTSRTMPVPRPTTIAPIIVIPNNKRRPPPRTTRIASNTPSLIARQFGRAGVPFGLFWAGVTAVIIATKDDGRESRPRPYSEPPAWVRLPDLACPVTRLLPHPSWSGAEKARVVS